MKPVAPVLRYVPERTPKPVEVTFAKDQPQYLPLPVIVHGEYVTSRWAFSLWERLHVLLFGFIFISQMNFGQALQPIRPSTEQPEPWQ